MIAALIMNKMLVAFLLRLNVYWSFLIADIISAVEFDRTGDFLATGDRGGRVVLFERNKQASAANCLRRCSSLVL